VVDEDGFVDLECEDGDEDAALAMFAQPEKKEKEGQTLAGKTI
jgi:hypothetical protein